MSSTIFVHTETGNKEGQVWTLHHHSLFHGWTWYTWHLTRTDSDTKLSCPFFIIYCDSVMPDICCCRNNSFSKITQNDICATIITTSPATPSTEPNFLQIHLTSHLSMHAYRQHSRQEGARYHSLRQLKKMSDYHNIEHNTGNIW